MNNFEDLADLSPGVEDHVRCPMCECPELVPLDNSCDTALQLGGFTHYRCRDCGWDFAVSEELGGAE